MFYILDDTPHMSSPPPTTEALWSRLRADLERFFERRTRDATTAADLLQETFLRIHGGLPHLRDGQRIVPWVWRVARNVLTDHRRRRADDTAVPEDAATPAPPPDANGEVGRWLLTALSTLPETYRQAVELAEVRGLKQDAIAHRLNLSLSGAKSRIQRGRRLLRDAILACCHLEFDRRGNVIEARRRDGAPPAPCCEDEDSP